MDHKRTITIIERPSFIGVRGISQILLSTVLNEGKIKHQIHASAWTDTLFVEYANKRDRDSAIAILCERFNVEEAT